jgi:formate dehydrogenase major subunit
MGSNMAENHPVGFQWVMEARERGARVFHIVPRFTRTSAMATDHIRIRAGTDIAFLGGVIHYLLENELYFEEYVKHYTNAPVIINEEFEDTEDLDGYFSGWNDEEHDYDIETWQYAGMEVHSSAGQREKGVGHGESAGSGGIPLQHGEPPEEDETLEHPRCVFQLLRKHYARYTPSFVAETCGCSEEELVDYCETIAASSGRERTGAFAYAVGWTQHTVGVQYIRAASIVQSLLGNIGRPGGGILALRGHASIQGSTDIPTLYNLLPGYLPMPHAHSYRGLTEYVEMNSAPSGWWGKTDAYMVSLLKAWWGEAATKENDFAFGYLPRIDKDDSTYRSTLNMLEGEVKGFLVVGENPAVGSANARAHRLAMANLEWLVVRDVNEIESATFWYDSPEIETGELVTEKIPTEVFFLPAAAHTEKDGSFTNTQRMLQFHYKAVEPKGDARSDLWFFYHLGRILRRKLRESDQPMDRPLLDLEWHYPTTGELEEPSAEAVLREINGWGPDGSALSGYPDLEPDGSTACGCWIYCGVYADEVNQAGRRKPYWEQESYVAPEWGWVWPANRRILYNRASADPAGNPWSERKRYVWWDGDEERWTSTGDTPDFTATKRPDYVPPDDAEAEDAISGDHPFIMQADGRAWLFVPSGLVDGPMPTHYEPHESPFRNPLYSCRANPRRQQFPRPENPYNPSGGQTGADAYPYVLTSYRLTEHHTAGGMTRHTAVLSELQPAMFCEVSPELAAERGLDHGCWATIVTARSAIEARVLVTNRMRPLTVAGRRIETVGVPYHWGSRGLTTGGSANDLFPIVLDPNVHIQEVKAASCDIRPGRRPRGKALRELVESYPRIVAGEEKT